MEESLENIKQELALKLDFNSLKLFWYIFLIIFFNYFES